MNSPAASPSALPVTVRLQGALSAALRARDMVAASAFRSALAAIANAGAVAVPPDSGRTAGSEHIAGAAAGVGAAEVSRRALTAAEAERIVVAEITDWEAAAAQFARLGKAEQAARLRHEAAVLVEVLAAAS